MIPFPNSISVRTVSDWVELYVITENKSISKMKVQNLFDEDGIDLESKMDDVLGELARRIQLYGPKSPVEVSGVTIRPRIKWRANPLYTLCLIFSTYGVQTRGDVGTRLFEQIGNVLLKEFFRSETYHLGFPVGAALNTSLDSVAGLMHETRGGITPHYDEKDSAVDVISWTPFNDVRSSQIIILAQCGAGDDWKEKSPISLPTWNHYINWNYETTVPSMITTQIVNPDKWRKYADKFGVLIDRARLYRIHADCSKRIPKDLLTETAAWCEAKLN